MQRTALAIRALQLYGTPAMKADFDKRIARARDCLLKAHARTNDEAAMQIAGLHWSPGSEDKMRALAKTLVAAIDELSHAMLKITGYVMKLAPLAVMAAMAATVAVNGLEILLKFAVFMGDFYIGLIILWGILVFAGFMVLGPRIFKLLSLIKEPFMLSFATASSEAAYPKILDALDRFGVKRKISSFVMPMGYSFNLDGSMMYCTFATLFIAQAYNIPISTGEQIAMLLLLMLTSKGMAGVPRASLVVIAATLTSFNIPEAGLLLVIGIDQFLDMGRSATNVIGNSLATAVVAKWEGEPVSSGGPAPLEAKTA